MGSEREEQELCHALSCVRRDHKLLTFDAAVLLIQ